VIKDTLAATAAGTGVYTLGNAITAIADGTDPLVALLAYALSAVPNPWLLVVGYVVWRFWGKDYLAQQQALSSKRSLLLDKLAESQAKMDEYIQDSRESAKTYETTHRAYAQDVPRIIESLNDIQAALNRKGFCPRQDHTEGG